MNGWHVIDTGRRTAEENMRIDAQLLAGLNEYSPSILHLYDWAGDSATYGYFVKPADFLNLEGVKQRGLTLARRPTGGGIVFHIWDFAFSVLVPAQSPHFSQNPDRNYQLINGIVRKAVEEGFSRELGLTLGDAAELDSACSCFCMARPTKYDVVIGGKKVAGAAQRQRRNGFLHQGTIALVRPSEDYLKEILLPGTRVLEGMQLYTSYIERDLEELRLEMKTLLWKHLLLE